MKFEPNEFFSLVVCITPVQFLHTAGSRPAGYAVHYLREPVCNARVKYSTGSFRFQASIPAYSWNRIVDYERRLMINSNADMNSDSKAHCFFLLRHLKLKLLGLVAERKIHSNKRIGINTNVGMSKASGTTLFFENITRKTNNRTVNVFIWGARVLKGSRHHPTQRTRAGREGGEDPTGGQGRCLKPAPRLPTKKGRAGATERGPPACPRAAARGRGRRCTSARADRRPADSWASLFLACGSLGSRRGPRGVGEWGRARRRGSGQGLRRRGLPRGRRVSWAARARARALSPDSRPRPHAEQPGPGNARGRDAPGPPRRGKPSLPCASAVAHRPFWETDTDLEGSLGSLVAGNPASGLGHSPYLSRPRFFNL